MRVKGSFLKDDNMIENIDITKETSGQLLANDPEYVRLVSHISDLWDGAKNKAVYAVNAELIDANWQTGQYIVEFEQGGNAKAKYGDKLLVNLSKDLTRLKGRGFSRSNLNYMRKLYLAFPICETLSHKLTWSHYFELLNYVLHERMHQRRMESQGVKTTNQFISFPKTCTQYR